MGLKFGIHSGPQNCTYEELRRLWQIADASGFHVVSIWDHFYDDPSVDGSGSCFEAISTITALSLETRNVRVGALALGIGYRHPAVIAKAAVTIDHINNGRFELGLGAGWLEREYRAFGIPYPAASVRLEMLEEGVEIIRSLLRNRLTSFRGRHFQVENAFCEPKPVQDHLRIWVCGGGERRTLRIAARYGDGWNVPYVSPEEYRHKYGVLDRWCEKEGRDPAGIARSVNVGFHLGATEADASRKRERFREDYGARAVQQEGGMLLGTPIEAVERIGEYVDAGAQGINIVMRAPFDWEALQAFIERVMPAFD